MRITLTGATGYVGSKLVAALKARGDEITVLSRNGARAGKQLGVDAADWDWTAGPAPADALAGRDAVVHLAGAPVAQRWNERAKQDIRDSREIGTQRLVDGLRDADPRPARLISASASAFYGPGGDEVVDERSPRGARLARRRLRALGARGGRRGRRARHERRDDPDRHHGRPDLRRRREHDAAVQARLRRAARGRPPVRAVDPSRRPHRPVPARDRRDGLQRARSTAAPPPP